MCLCVQHLKVALPSDYESIFYFLLEAFFVCFAFYILSEQSLPGTDFCISCEEWITFIFLPCK